MGPDGHWVEVQIRSERMDQIAEKGLAAHWLYKKGEKREKGVCCEAACCAFAAWSSVWPYLRLSGALELCVAL